VIEVRPMRRDEIELVDQHLPLDRLDQPGGEWLVAWEGDVPVGHAHVDLRSDPPEVQNVYVADEQRRRGVATKLTAAAERLVREHGFDRIALDVDVDSVAARALYEKLGYREKGTPPRRVHGSIVLRGKPFTFDAVLIDLVKRLD